MNVDAKRPEAVIAVIQKNGHILMIQRAFHGPGGGYWTPPGGRIEAGESQARAVEREVLEEVGLHVRPLRRVWQCETDDGTYHLHWWLAQYVAGEVTVRQEEVHQARWMTVDEFLALQKTFQAGRYFFRHVFPTITSHRFCYPQ